MLSLEIHPDHPEPRKIGQAVKILEDGGVAFYPTDTVYALGCALEARRAVERIQRLRKLDSRRPLALLCADLKDCAKYGVVSNFAYRQMHRLLPGPYTFILPATREVPRVLLDKRRTVGVRVPANLICQALVAALGRPLLTSSAIPPDEEDACLDVEAALEHWPGESLDLTIDGGTTPGKVSTVVSLIDDRIEIVRAGLGIEELE